MLLKRRTAASVAVAVGPAGDGLQLQNPAKKKVPAVADAETRKSGPSRRLSYESDKRRRPSARADDDIDFVHAAALCLCSSEMSTQPVNRTRMAGGEAELSDDDDFIPASQ